MSSIPPNVVGPILQSGIQQQQAARQLEGEREQQDALSAKASRRSEQAEDTIAASDEDLQVSSDSEGSGSQGREAAESSEDEQAESAAGRGGIRRDADGQMHLDIEA